MPGGTGKTAVGVPAAAQTTWNRPRSGSMTVRTGRVWPNGGIPPMTKPVSSCASRRGRPADVALAGDGGQAGEVDPVRARHEAEDRLERAVVGRARRRRAT